MRILMISLDKNILDKNSRAARRMIEYGKTDELFIILPSRQKKSFDLSQSAHVQSTGGLTKIKQLFNLYCSGRRTIEQFNNLTIEQLITVQDPFFIGLIGWLLKRKFKINMEVQLHGDFLSDYYKRQSLLKYWLSQFIIKRADKLRVVSDRIKQSLIRYGAEASIIEVRPISIDVEYIKNYQPRLNVHKKYPGYEKIFLVLGRLDTVKNITWLIDVFAQVVKEKQGYLLLVVGSGEALSTIKLQITNYKLQNNIIFEPWTSDPISYLKTSDCLLLSSLSEGYGLVAMEAHAAGTPIIMNDVGVANYELKSGDKVKIIPVSSQEAWIKAILEV